MMPIRLVIHGGPVVLKNSKQVIRVGGRTIVKSSAKVEAYQHKAIGELCEQWQGRGPIDGPINLAIESFGAWKRSSGHLPDASNLYQMPEDLLEVAGVIDDDRQIESHDGSRRICMCDTCDARPVYKAGPRQGKRKADCGAVKKCPHQKVVLEVKEL